MNTDHSAYAAYNLCAEFHLFVQGNPFRRIQETGAGGCRVPEVPAEAWFPEAGDPRRYLAAAMIEGFMHERGEIEPPQGDFAVESMFASANSIFGAAYRGTIHTLELELELLRAVMDFYRALIQVETAKFPNGILPTKDVRWQLDHVQGLYPMLDEGDRDQLRPYVAEIMRRFFAMINARVEMRRNIAEDRLTYLVYLLTYLRPF